MPYVHRVVGTLTSFAIAMATTLYAITGDVRAVKFRETPMLESAVKYGTLPPAVERLHNTPMIITPNDKVGQYGGTWDMAQSGERDHALLIPHHG